MTVREISADDLSLRLARGERTLLVDVRQPWEHELARLPGSLLLPLHELPSRTAEVPPDPGQLVVCYCHHGVRSLRAAEVLAGAGVAGVVSLAGGIDAWSLQIDPSVPRY
jgi:rhodanese-related sulfurtransferase